MEDRFYRVSAYPDEVSAGAAIARLLDGLGFRFYWSVSGLDESDFDFTPGRGCNSIGDIVRHIWGLMNWILINVHGRTQSRPKSLMAQKEHILEMISNLRDFFTAADADTLSGLRIEELPFWHLINGPIADAVSHVGQINILRRLRGSEPVKANVFTCTPPPEANS